MVAARIVRVYLGREGQMRNGTAHHNGRSYRPPAGDRNGGGTLARLRRATGDTLGATRRVLALVWGTHRGLTAGLGTLTLLRSAVPASEVWLGKLLVDAVAEAITTGAGMAYVPRIVALAAAALGHDSGDVRSEEHRSELQSRQYL